MQLPQFQSNPFQLRLSFHKIIESLEQTSASDTGYPGDKARELLLQVDAHPELRDGITSIEQIENNGKLIAALLSDLFPAVLTNNEIKAVTIPYQPYIFNKTERFKKILAAAGSDFKSNIRDFDEHQFYVFSCCLVLNRFYGTKLDFSRPLFYDIPTADGVARHYRILYNADFIDIIPTEKSVPLTDEEIVELIDNYDDLDLWKAKFPPDSYILKGFSIMTLIDVTVENAVSHLKTKLLSNSTSEETQYRFEAILKSIFGLPDLRMGFTTFDQETMRFTNTPFGKKLQSFLLPENGSDDLTGLLCQNSYQSLIVNKSYFAVSDMDEYIAANPGNEMGNHFKSQGIQSFILAPVVRGDVLLGILELVSPRKREFNSVNAHKLEVVMPLLIDSVERRTIEVQNKIRAVIQNNYTTLHPSVDWKFRREAQNWIRENNTGSRYRLKQIVFKEVYPLYGQVDIIDSSITRNLSIKNDLKELLNQTINIVEQLRAHELVADTERYLFDLNAFNEGLSLNVYSDTEQQIQQYVEANIHPLFKSTDYPDQNIAGVIANYFSQMDVEHGDFYTNRRNYEKTLSMVNTKLTDVLDARQEEIQHYYPHYYERFKTDGVEHNLYMGATIAPKQPFSPVDLQRLRLWQLRVIAELETELYDLYYSLPYRLGVTSLILVFSNPIAIRFRMDEKHFDIDGAYNIRYEVIKKRIDKAHIKNTSERITKRGTITIVYFKNEDEEEYRRYIGILQKAGILAYEIEHFEVEELQGVSGLKALRVGVLYENANTAKLTYDKLYERLAELQITMSTEDQNLNPAEM